MNIFSYHFPQPVRVKSNHVRGTPILWLGTTFHNFLLNVKKKKILHMHHKNATGKCRYCHAVVLSCAIEHFYLQKLARLINHVRIYGSNLAAGFSAFQRRSCCSCSTLRMQIKPLNYLKTVSKVADLTSTIAMTVHCFGALTQVRTIGHCVIGQERNLLWPDWLNW